MPLRTLATLFLGLSLAGCSDGDRAERAEQRAKQIEADMKTKAEAGELPPDEFLAGLEEMAELAEEVRAAERPAEPQAPPPSAEELRAAQQKFNQDLARNVLEANARLARRPPPSRPIEEIRAEATAAADALAARYEELLRTLRDLEAAQPTSGERGLVRHELAQVERHKERDLTRVRDAITSDQPTTIEQAGQRAGRVAESVTLSIDNATKRLRRLQPEPPRR